MTDKACPRWCIRHDPDDGVDFDGRRFVVHRGRAIDVDSRPWPLEPSRLDEIRPNGDVVSRTHVDDGTDEPLTAAEARELAHALLAVAAVLEVG